MEATFERRTRACREELRSLGEDALILFPGPTLYYLTGIDEEPSERHFLLVLPAEGDPVLFVPELSAAQVREETWIDDVRGWPDDADPREQLAALLDDLEIPAEARLLLDDRLWATFVLDLETIRPDADFGRASEVLSDLRMRKDEREIDAMAEAARVADEVSIEIRGLGEAAVGMTESELAREIDARMRERGGEPSFETIVGSGPNGANPHHRHGDRVIEAGDPVVLDFGCYLDAYPSDQTRTVVFGGEPPAEFEPVFGAVREAQQAGIEAVEPGITAGEIDRAAREVIESRGYGDSFIHRTGHGVGLEVHEPPYIVEGNDQPLEEGMVFSVEPGVYLEDEFGVRIEDIVVVTGDGTRRLNDSPRGWR